MITQRVDRRSFLKAGAGGLLLGFYLPESSRLKAQTGAASKLNAYVHIRSDDTVTLFIHMAEMGQGTVTSLSMLLAEELECDWNKIRTEFPGVDKAFGSLQGVFGSRSIRTSWEPLRKAGASAREMLTEAAAQNWGVAKAQCRAENGVVINTATNARMSYGQLAESAAKLPVPSSVALKDPKQFRLIGTSPKRLDTPDKVNGRTLFGIDVRLPGMQYAVIARCPVFGGKVANFDGAKAKAVAGVKQVFAISNGVAVVADNTWSAMEGRKALEVQWDEGSNANASSASIRKLFVELAEKPGATARKEGDAEAGLAGAAKKIEAVYEAPYLAHAPMEPLNCVAHVRSDSCEVWASTQIQTAARGVAAKVTGLAPEKVQVHTMYLGGGFGRRGGSDYIAEAVEVAKAAGGPVKVTWSREDDLQHDTYRPASYSRFSAGLDSEGWPVAWFTRIACPSFGGIQNGVDHTGVEGVADILYGIPNILVEYHAADAGIPVSYWRSVGYSQNTFFTESFVDELAVAGGKDPLELRRRLLRKSPRMLGALELAAAKAGWGQPLPKGRFRGMAVVNNIGSFNAQVAEISVSQGKLRVHRVVCAVDCGQVVNPRGVEQQIQSGIVFGLTAALKGAITIDRGRVQQQNFHQYDVLRIDEMPVVEVHLVPSRNSPGGIGESSTPGIAPALANALFAATGKRVRRLPIRAEDLA
ncbi:MAG TPA: xanthine dehydrogenase family protein molybdopterin-binding subunit [Bryobacteraceae bacterium]|jgi:isoquinoline 1-oxidoreductase beta subunit|nr:xanthine dehydrogenase family protein molybdopterin-binding subunit [Bryobacteraceae bacterium]